MNTIHAIFEGGVFRPIEPVDLPEKSQVEFEPRMVQLNDADLAALIAAMEPGQRKIYEILSQRFDGSESDVAARHNEHQP